MAKVKVTEVQDRKTTREYNISGPKVDTVESFWEYLVAHNQIESYEIKEV